MTREVTGLGFGTSTTSDLRRQRALARAVLAVLVGLLATFVAFSGGSFGPFSALAQQPTPSPSGPQIEWVNPSVDEDSSTELSIKLDVDELYHLNTWVGNVPNQPHVEFEIIASGGATSSIGPATRRGNDAFDNFWNLGGLADGDYTLRAILFSGFTGPGTGTEVDRVEIAVEINNMDDGSGLPGDPDDQSETIELTYPGNGGGLGVFTNTQGAHSFVIDGTASAGTTFARAFLSTTQPGLAPSWTTGCGGYQAPQRTEPNGTKIFRIRCTLSSGQTPSFVTGVAMVSNDTPSPPAMAAQANPTFDDSADAHRVLPYSQSATSVTIDPPQQSDRTAGQCSDNIRATVLDQSGRLISGINVDVHAKGPTDQLRFNSDTGSGRTANQAPNSNHPDSEPAWNCGSNASGGTQGEHNVTGADPEGADVKHVEAATDGTNINGEFVFALRSVDNGATQFTAWADADDNDRFCAQERSGSGSIGWGQGAPAVTALPAEEPGPCPARTASPSPSPTGSPSPSPTGSPSPSPTGSPSPSPTGSPSPSPTESPGPVVQRGPCEGHSHNSRQPRDDGVQGEVIVGSNGNDELVGGQGHDIICGLRGADTIRGLAGHDLQVGGPGPDTVFGGLGRDDTRGNAGNDDLRGNRGHDVVRGGGGRDVLRGNRGNDRLNGGRGLDRCFGGPGNDTFRNCERRFR